MFRHTGKGTGEAMMSEGKSSGGIPFFPLEVVDDWWRRWLLLC
jgi:hypothetical protein